ncbi:MAG: SurA N-terminal domain-containing protein [Pseudonocardiales bacterium]
MTRSLWRRCAAVAVLCLIGLTGLTGCRTQAGVAAFVGTTRISEDNLRGVSDQGLAQRAIKAQVGGDVAGYRQLILSRLIRRQLIEDSARKLRVSVSKGDVDQYQSRTVAQLGGRAQVTQALAQVKLPPSQLRPFLRELLLIRKIGERLTQGVTFTDAQLRKYYDEHGGASNGGTFEQLKADVINAMRGALGEQEAEAYVTTYLKGVALKVNPRFGRFDRSKLFTANDASSVVTPPDALVRDTAAKVKPSPAP